MLHIIVGILGAFGALAMHLGRSGMKKLDRNMDQSLDTLQSMLMLGNSDFGIPTMKEINLFDATAFAIE